AVAAPYDVKAFDAVRIGSDSTKPDFQHADAEVDLEHGPFARVTISVDLATTCFPFSKWKDDPPPPGQNWPADCDAFDRNFELSFDDPDKDTDPPGLEVMRAITPFGGPEHQDVDVTDVANALAPGKHRLRVVIPTYSDAAGQVSGSNGGWNVTATVHVVPGTPPRRVLAVVPLFDGAQTTPASPKPIGFDVPAGTKHARIEYRVTGHGGAMGDGACIGPAEEFCDRLHTVFVDGAKLDEIYPWKLGCGSECTLAHYDDGMGGGFDYCAENPCGDPNSVTAPRANWCPGALTPPFTWDAPALDAPGHHTFSWTISNVADGGQWRISAAYFAFGD
ncbi:MAG TPA: peptide-N-glycosidase F-related protein, partial [Minicystis sp.]|nr:peptide-N-glycosidase F-related protein [Minicystis sp.]